MATDALIASVKDHFAKAKDWADQNRGLALGAGAAAALATLGTLLAVIPAWRARTSNRVAKKKLEGRLLRRSLEENDPNYFQELDDEEFLEFLNDMVKELSDD